MDFSDNPADANVSALAALCLLVILSCLVLAKQLITKWRGCGAAASPEDKTLAITALLLAHLAGVEADTCLHLAGMRSHPKTTAATALTMLGFLVPAACGVGIDLWLNPA